MIPVDIAGLQVEETTGAPVVLLREHEAPHRVLPIFIGGPEAASIALALSSQTPPRPLTHDLLVSLVEHLDARVERVEVTLLRDGVYFAELAVSGPEGPQRLDSRPSDAIALAVRVQAPLFVAEAVLDEAGAVVDVTGGEPPDEQAIEEEVAAFRSRLENLDPGHFPTDEPGGSGPE
ncbi:MAG TPA: bifunctional nuclease family protein [Acidimicrobiales bacterium]|nr:bifunctional nuclease family protein [Acidimicrobiales bacterium]